MIEQIAKTTLQKTMPTGDKVEIGDKGSTDFKPHLKLNRWGGECFINVGLPVTEKSLPIIDGDKIIWEGRDKNVIMYPLAPSKQFELGGYEYEIILENKPLTNRIALDIESQGLRFLYQPPLTQEELDVGDIRPDNIVGSYAVYRVTEGGLINSRGKDYKAGKAFHIPRPKIFDSRGDWVWGELFIGGGKQIITIPQDFLNSAIYPIRHAAGETFGYTSIGSSGSSSTDRICAGKWTLPEDGDATSITFYSDGTTGGANAKCAIYEADLSYVQTTPEQSIAAVASWYTISFSVPESLSAADFILAVWSAGVANIRRDADAGVDRWWQSETYNGWPDPIGASDRSGKFSIYCTYTPAVAGWAGGDVNGVAVATIAKINGVAIADIVKVNGIA